MNKTEKISLTLLSLAIASLFYFSSKKIETDQSTVASQTNSESKKSVLFTPQQAITQPQLTNTTVQYQIYSNKFSSENITTNIIRTKRGDPNSDSVHVTETNITIRTSNPFYFPGKPIVTNKFSGKLDEKIAAEVSFRELQAAKTLEEISKRELSSFVKTNSLFEQRSGLLFYEPTLEVKDGAIVGGRGFYLSKGESYTDIGFESDVQEENFRFLQEARKHIISILTPPFLIEYRTGGIQGGILQRRIYQIDQTNSEGNLTLLQELETYDPEFQFNDLDKYFRFYNPTNKKLIDTLIEEKKKN